LGAQHPLGTVIWSSEKVDLGGMFSPLDLQSFWTKVHCTVSPQTRKKSRYINYLSNFKYLHPFRRYSPLKFEVVQNQAKFCMFLAPKIFLGRPPEILYQHYKIRPTTNHRAKLHADQPRRSRVGIKT